MVLKGLDVLGVGVDLMSVVINNVAFRIRREAAKVFTSGIVGGLNSLPNNDADILI